MLLPASMQEVVLQILGEGIIPHVLKMEFVPVWRSGMQILMGPTHSQMLVYPLSITMLGMLLRSTIILVVYGIIEGLQEAYLINLQFLLGVFLWSPFIIMDLRFQVHHHFPLQALDQEVTPQTMELCLDPQ